VTWTKTNPEKFKQPQSDPIEAANEKMK
jgi:hypothetical protein